VQTFPKRKTVNTPLPPHNTDAEMCVLGTILLEQNQLEIALESLAASDFYHSRHNTIFQIFRDEKRQGRDLDFISVSDSLTKSGNLEKIGGTKYLAELTERSIGAYHFEGLCQMIKEKSLARQLVTVSREIQERAFDQSFPKVSDLIDFAQKKIFDLDHNSGGKETIHKIHDVMISSISEIERRYKAGSAILGISSGYGNIDALTNGFKPKELIVIAARPSMGKTAFSLNLVHNIAVKQKKNLAYFSIEMPRETLVMRMLASTSGIPLDLVMAGRISDTQWPRLIQAASNISETGFLIDDSNPLSPNELRSRCRRTMLAGGLDCVVVDYLQMMKVKDQRMESREREVAEISATLKSIAKELNVPVIALAQLNRDVAKRPDKRPSLSDLSQSGAIEMDADIIMMIHREEYYDRENSEIKGKAEIIVEKNRNGKTGVAKMHFNSSLNLFAEETR